MALYVAAHCGHADLALTLIKTGGVRADEPVGYHPSRQWCQAAVKHIDSEKTPIHESSEAGQLGVLRSFVHLDISNVLARDGNGLTPLNVALRSKQKGCASFLLTKQWSKVIGRFIKLLALYYYLLYIITAYIHILAQYYNLHNFITCIILLLAQYYYLHSVITCTVLLLAQYYYLFSTITCPISNNNCTVLLLAQTVLLIALY